jgi:hypothetical protein
MFALRNTHYNRASLFIKQDCGFFSLLYDIYIIQLVRWPISDIYNNINIVYIKH